jgi:hypothetical protein
MKAQAQKRIEIIEGFREFGTQVEVTTKWQVVNGKKTDKEGTITIFTESVDAKFSAVFPFTVSYKGGFTLSVGRPSVTFDLGGTVLSGKKELSILEFLYGFTKIRDEEYIARTILEIID